MCDTEGRTCLNGHGEDWLGLEILEVFSNIKWFCDSTITPVSELLIKWSESCRRQLGLAWAGSTWGMSQLCSALGMEDGGDLAVQKGLVERRSHSTEVWEAAKKALVLVSLVQKRYWKTGEGSVEDHQDDYKVGEFRVVELFESKGTLKGHVVQFPCNEQELQQLHQVLNSVQPDLDMWKNAKDLGLFSLKKERLREI